MVLAVDANHKGARTGLGLIALHKGSFRQGLHLYRARSEAAWRLGSHNVATLQPGETLLVRSEQGLGDIIQMSRYARALEQHGHEVYFAVPRTLLSLLHGTLQDERLVPLEEAFPVNGRSIPMFSMLEHFTTDVGLVIPSATALHVSAARSQRWAAWLPGHGVRVGLCWRCDRRHPSHKSRSISVEELRPVLELAGITYVSLQHDPTTDEIRALGDSTLTPPAPFDGEGDAFADTVALMEQLDAVLTVDTSVAHVAGSLGILTFLLLKHVPDWRWQAASERTGWYPSMTLLRQDAPGDWSAAIERAVVMLRALLESMAVERG